jgi:hypothetical protein
MRCNSYIHHSSTYCQSDRCHNHLRPRAALRCPKCSHKRPGNHFSSDPAEVQSTFQHVASAPLSWFIARLAWELPKASHQTCEFTASCAHQEVTGLRVQ